jgi:hypothetical protein
LPVLNCGNVRKFIAAHDEIPTKETRNELTMPLS